MRLYKLSFYGNRLHYLSSIKSSKFFGLFTGKPKWLPVYPGGGSMHRDTPILRHQVERHPSLLMFCLRFTLRANGEFRINKRPTRP